jgi:predicted nucleotidyltransferase/uncharacterized protein (UPF0332 family)
MKKKGGKKEVRKLVGDREIAMDFAAKAQEKFDRIIKASILFGSQTKNTTTTKSDIDIIIVIDDASIDWDLELIAWYREELGKLIAAKDYGRNLHINTVKLTTWWQDLIHGDPVVLNILRYGEPLIDLGGFFTPLKSLLEKGKIKATQEAAFVSLQRAPAHLVRSKIAEMGAIEGIYWKMVDSAQAALIIAGKIPPSPENIGEMLKEAFADTGMLSMGYIRAFNDLFALHKDISHGKVSEVKGAEIDRWQGLAEKFMSEMTGLINKMLEKK